MFTGLVERVGTVREVSSMGGGHRLAVESGFSNLELGQSVAVAGACLTVVRAEAGSFWADVSVETIERTTLGQLRVGSKVNLELPLTVGAPIGGHWVTGHVDAVVAVLAVEAAPGDALRMEFALPPSLLGLVAEKGSACVDGVSLTVNRVTDRSFEVMVIPHTRSVTTLGALAPGDLVNLEVDLLSRYVARWLEVQKAPK